MKKEELKALLSDMSLKEKADQLMQLMGVFYTADSEEVMTGPARQFGIEEADLKLAGSILGAHGAKQLMEIQKNYMEKHPHKIPLLFMLDVIHGFKTVFPMPLALGATFDPDLAGQCAAVAAKESAVSGLHVTFSPMVDLVRDARWGRVVESNGEDPYLNGLFAAAQVRGFQGDDMSEPYKLCACIKHFAAYGGAQAGRDYNTVELTEHTLRDFYLKSYQAGIDAGVGMVMTSFNTVNGIPASANKWLMRDILRDEMGFDGVLISDFSAILETVAHGHSTDARDAAGKGLKAGVDIDMMTNVYASHLCDLIGSGDVDEALLDESVMRVLELKNKLGLFENPYKDADPEKEKTFILCDEHRKIAREAAGKSFVLLKNDGILPLNMEKKIAFIGPYTNNPNILSSWAVVGEAKDCITIEQAAREVFDASRTTYHTGSPVLDPGFEMLSFEGVVKDETTEEEREQMLREAIEAAKAADIVVMPIGEHFQQTGEAASRAMIDVPKIQMQLFREIARVNENIVVVLFNGRPLDLREISASAKAVLEVWFPGTEGGHAIVDALTGMVNPSGKLPMSFPYCVGQVPVFYNAYSTGRPDSPDVKEKFRSKYLDIPNEPLYPFGFGLSYTNFDISQVALSQDTVTDHQPIKVNVAVRNTGDVCGTQTVQLYIQDVSASVVRPVKELKGFKKVALAPGEEQAVEFVIDEPMLRFLRADKTVGSEPGLFRVWVGDSSVTENMAEFRLK